MGRSQCRKLLILVCCQTSLIASFKALLKRAGHHSNRRREPDSTSETIADVQARGKCLRMVSSLLLLQDNKTYA